MAQILMFYRWISLNKGPGSRSWPEIKLFWVGFKLEKGGQLSESNDKTYWKDFFDYQEKRFLVAQNLTLELELIQSPAFFVIH